MTTQGRWSDLAVRMGSGAVMVALGLAAVAAGGELFYLFVAMICGAMVWELVRMLAPHRSQMALLLGFVAGLAILASAYLPAAFALPLLMAPALLGFGQLENHRVIYLIFAVLISLAGFGLMQLRDDFGFGWMLWLALVVVATDVAGYFAGKAFGGPKFWPRVSPNKTWSGTIGGWVAAAVVGLGYVIFTAAPWGAVPVSVAVSMAAQMGDIGESAVKRQMGVKDSSNLIPGHGGLMDRFDGMLGASVFVLMTLPLTGFPPGAT